jgi:hypothetical protein
VSEQREKTSIAYFIDILLQKCADKICKKKHGSIDLKVIRRPFSTNNGRRILNEKILQLSEVPMLPSVAKLQQSQDSLNLVILGLCAMKQSHVGLMLDGHQSCIICFVEWHYV